MQQTVNNNLTIYQLLKSATKEEPNKEAIFDLNKRWTFEQLLADVDHLANILNKKGIQKGDRIASSLPNWYETALLIFATAKIGAILVPFNPLYQVDEATHILKDSQPKMFFTTDLLGKDSLDILFQYTSELIVVQGEVTGYETFSSLADEEAPTVQEIEIDVMNDTYCILYTSGTTGAPKGVMIPHRSLVQSGLTIAEELYCNKYDVYITAAPLFHIFGMACNLFSAVARCSKTVLIERYSPELMLETIEQEKVTIHQGVPTMFLKELEVEDFKKYDVSSLRAGIVGAAPITPDQMRKIRTKLGMNLCQSYGTTETGSVTMTPYDDREDNIVTTLGKPIPGVKIKIVDKNRSPLPVNEVGEIAIHSFGTMKGYYNLSEETNEVIDGDGWFYTGDLGRLDKEGNLCFSGREKELIIRGGFNIYPQEIEEILLKIPEITDSAVIGLPDDILGERVCAVVKTQNQNITKEGILEYVAQHVSVYKVPQEVVFVDDFPMTPSGKIQKNILKKEIIANI